MYTKDPSRRFLLATLLPRLGRVPPPLPFPKIENEYHVMTQKELLIVHLRIEGGLLIDFELSPKKPSE